MDDVPLEQRLLHTAIDYRAKHSGDRVYAYLPKDDRGVQDGFYPLNYRDLAKAIDAASWWMDETLGLADNGFPTFPYIGSNDVRYVILGMAAFKTRRQFMIPFPANTDEGLLKLLLAADCKIVAAPKSLLHVWDHATTAMPHLRPIEVPELGHFLHDRPIDPYPYHKTLSEAMDDPALVMQTSGTTGNPQPIFWGHRRLYQVYENMDLSNKSASDMKIALYELSRNAYRPSLVPLSWSAGFMTTAVWPVFLGAVSIYLPSSWASPPSVEQIYETLLAAPKGPRNTIMLTPDVLREFCREPARLEALKTLDWIGYAGAPLDRETGNFMWKQIDVRVQSMHGSTDSDAYPLLLNDPEDWEIVRFYPDFDGFHLQFFAEDLFELCITRQPNDERHCFKVAPNLKEFHTRDLFQAVPGREGFWHGAGRVDDFVKLASMTKFNAVNMEQELVRHPDIQGALVAGDARHRPFVLLQLSPNLTGDRAEILDRVWPTFEEINQHTYKDAQLSKELTLFTDTNMPLRRTAKGTLDRRNTIAMYGSKIEELYGKAASKENGHG